MMNPGLDAAGVQYMQRLCASTHSVRIVVSLLDLNHNHIMDLSDKLYDGQVNISSSSEYTRTSTLRVWDPERAVGLDTRSPDNASLYYNRMIKITYCIWGYGDHKSIDIPLFCGPIDRQGGVTRQGGFLDIRCLGKELLAKNVVWSAYPFGTGANKVAVLKSLMQMRGGETKFDLEPHAAKYPKPGVTFAKEAIVWDEAQKIARSVGKQLFYDGRGVLRLRTVPQTVAFKFRDGRGGSIVNPPSIGKTDEELKNLSWVVGTKPKGAKTVPTGVATLPATHPLNHYQIGRKVGNVTIPHILLAREDIQGVTKPSDAQARANQKRDNYALQQAALASDVLAMPFLEEMDLVGYEIQGEFSTNYRVMEMSIPLSGPVGSFGTSKNLSVRKLA